MVRVGLAGSSADEGVFTWSLSRRPFGRRPDRSLGLLRFLLELVESIEQLLVPIDLLHGVGAALGIAGRGLKLRLRLFVQLTRGVPVLGLLGRVCTLFRDFSLEIVQAAPGRGPRQALPGEALRLVETAAVEEHVARLEVVVHVIRLALEDVFIVLDRLAVAFQLAQREADQLVIAERVGALSILLDEFRVERDGSLVVFDLVVEVGDLAEDLEVVRLASRRSPSPRCCRFRRPGA
jgi:hypothetical protein